MSNAYITVCEWDKEQRKFVSRMETEEYARNRKYMRSAISGYYYPPEKLLYYFEVEEIGRHGITRNVKLMGEDETQHTKKCCICNEPYSKNTKFSKTVYTGAKKVCPACVYRIKNSILEEYHKDFIRKIWPPPKKDDWGIEIEVITKSRNPKVSKKIRLHGWAVEEDGSLGRGMEVISPPMPYERLLKSLPTIVKKIRMAAVPTKRKDVGIHISFDSSEASKLSILKFIEFINSNPFGLCEIVARRKDNFYSEYHNFKILGKRIDMKTLWNYINNMSRRSAVNTQKMPRIEVRIFKTTTNIKTIFAALQFVKAVKDMCFITKGGVYHRSTNPDKNVMLKEFMEFINKNPKEYKLLRKFIVRNSHKLEKE